MPVMPEEQKQSAIDPETDDNLGEAGPPTQPSAMSPVMRSGYPPAEGVNPEREYQLEFPAAPSDFPPENLSKSPSFYPPPRPNTRPKSVIDTVAQLAKDSLETGMRMQALIEGYRQVIIQIFELAEQNKTLMMENEKLKRENYKLRRWIKGLVEQNNFLRLNAHCCKDGQSEACEADCTHTMAGGNGKSLLPKEIETAVDCKDRLLEQDMIDKATRENEQLRAEFEKLKAENQELKNELNGLRNEVEKYKAPCGCDRRSFKRTELTPLRGLAKVLYKKALVATQQKNIARNSKEGKVSGVVHTLLMEALKDYNRRNKIRQSRRNLKKINETMRDLVKEITEELLSVKDIGVHQVAQILSQAYVSPKEKIDIGEIQEIKPAKFRELCALLEAKKSTEPYFEELRKVVRDAQYMRIPHIWREKEGEDRADRSLMEYAAKQANKYAAAFLGEHRMDPEIIMTNSMMELQKIIRDCMRNADRLPVNEKNYKRLISAATKIRFMHLAETIKSQIDFKTNDKITSHLKEKIGAYTEYTEEGKPVLTIGELSEDGIYRKDDRRDNRAIVVESIDVRNSKNEIAIARKHMVKDADGNNNYDPSKIHDFTGLRIELTERDSQTFVFEDGQGRTESPIQQATEKILSLLCAIFGSDLPRSRLRYSYDKGSVNEYSTGNHRAFQITFRYRHQCVVNGNNGNGYPKMKSTSVEVQIVVNMDKKERDDDHREYEKKKDRTIQNVMGMDRSFPVWLSDLADVVLDEKELVCETHDSTNLTALTDREYIAKLLFTAITKKSSDGRPENARALAILLNDEQERRKLKKAAKKYVDYTPLCRKHRMDKGMEVANNKVSLNRMAAEALEIIENYKKGTGTAK